MGIGKITSRTSAYSILDKASYALVFLAGICFMLSNIELTPTPIGIITSRSMEPIMTLGDVVFIQPIAIEDVKVGEIIAYHSPPDKTVIHRVVQIKTYPGKILLITQGDANTVTDQSLGFPPVTVKNLIGKVFLLDGAPVRIPIVGLYIVEARNFAIWLTQNKIWAFWGPLVAIIYVFGPYLSPSGISRFSLRDSLRVKIPVKRFLTYILIAFVAISAFTFYFKTEAYTLSMRVACLLETKEPTYISFGSMTYGDERDNTIEVTGAPLFPVKTVAMVLGNASMLVFPEPKTMIVEPQEYTTLNLHAKIPPRGEVEPGIYTGTVYIFSDTLLLILPDTFIFSAFYAMPDPWATLIVLDFVAASLLAFLIAFIAVSVNTTSTQMLYTLVWHDKLERGFPSKLRMKMHNLRLKISSLNERISRRICLVSSTIKHEVEINKMLKPAILAATPSAALFLLLDNLLLPVITLGAAMSLLLWRIHVRKKNELVTSAFFANILITAAFIIRRSVTILYAQINALWCLVSASFVGDISYLITVPIVLAIILTLVFGLDWTRVWYIENQTLNWNKIRSRRTIIKKTISIPSLEEFERLKRRRIKFSPPPIPSEESVLMAKISRRLMAVFRVPARWIKEKARQISWSIRIWSNRSVLYPYIEGEL
ncbi:MAG: signal peptidase I [Candidatus Bathyarchaeia archaeon]